MEDRDIGKVLELIAAEVEEIPAVSKLGEKDSDPFLILVATMLSARTKDEVTAGAVERLFKRAKSPKEMSGLSLAEIEDLIYPVGFYRVKARHIHEMCHDLQERFHAQVPDSLDGLLSLKGVGRKTANLVLALGFKKDGLCVDTHVHRISNRWGYVCTKDPAATEFALRDKLPRRYWSDYNTLLVAFGRSVCRPVSPLCSTCPVARLCGQVGVTRKR